jgi:nucleoside-diphosphate-sugar epimerase
MVTLVTGATGFIGHRLVTALLERGDTVRGLVRDVGRAQSLRERGVELIRGDMTDADALQRAVRGVECIYHTAAVVGDWPDPVDTRRVNVHGTRSLLQCAVVAGVRRVVHFSSLAVYGNRHHHETDESAPFRYGDTYTDAKIDSERAVLEFGPRGCLEIVRLRPGFVYGPGDRLLVPKLLDALVRNKFLYVGDGTKQMNCVYIDDLAKAALLAGSKPEAAGHAYNVTDGSRTPLREFVTFVADSLHFPAPTRRVPAPLAVVGCYGSEYLARLFRIKEAPLMNISRLRFLYYNQSYSIEKARRGLGYTPRFTYREGLPPTLEWFGRVGLLPPSLAALAS